jgi:hypothetical protein
MSQQPQATVPGSANYLSLECRASGLTVEHQLDLPQAWKRRTGAAIARRDINGNIRSNQSGMRCSNYGPTVSAAIATFRMERQKREYARSNARFAPSAPRADSAADVLTAEATS